MSNFLPMGIPTRKNLPTQVMTPQSPSSAGKKGSAKNIQFYVLPGLSRLYLANVAKSPSPSLAGQAVTVDWAVLLAPVHNGFAPSQVSPVTYLRTAPCYSGGTAPAYTGFPIKSLTPNPNHILFALLMISFIISIVKHTWRKFSLWQNRDKGVIINTVIAMYDIMRFLVAKG